MRVKVRLFAGLRERVGSAELELADLEEPLDVAGLKRELERRHATLGRLDAVRGAVADEYVADDTPLSDGQTVILIPPVSGGAPDPVGPGGTGADLERGRFEVRAEPLDPLEAHRRVADPACGAVVLFTGTTRGRNRGKDVVELDYEAFESMAGKEMTRIFEECVRRFGPESAASGAASGEPAREPDELRLRMLVLHRSGRVLVGEPSVVIAVASPHRDAAFRAARFLIDELKARVPLWKKEVYADGHHWVGERS